MSKSIYVPTAGDIYIYVYMYIYIYNNFSLERGPRGEWGPGSPRARVKSFNLEPLTRARADPGPLSKEIELYIYICMSPIYI